MNASSRMMHSIFFTLIQQFGIAPIWKLSVIWYRISDRQIMFLFEISHLKTPK